MGIDLSQKNSSGFTLVEVMITSVIAVILALTIGTLFYNSQSQQTKIENRAARAQVVDGAALDVRLKPPP